MYSGLEVTKPIFRCALLTMVPPVFVVESYFFVVSPISDEGQTTATIQHKKTIYDTENDSPMTIC